MGSSMRSHSSATSGWEFFSKSDTLVVKGFQVPGTSPDSSFLSYNMIHEDRVIHCSESPKKSKNSLPRENRLSDAVLKYVNQVLLDDDVEDKSCMVEESTLEAAEKSFYDVLNDNVDSKKYVSSCPYHPPFPCDNTICSCDYINTNDLFDKMSDLQNYYKSSVCSCHSGPKGEEATLLNTATKKNPVKLVRVRSLGLEESNLVQRRSNKHLAICPEESGLHQMFDDILSLYDKRNDEPKLSNANLGDNPLPSGGAAKKGLSKREAVNLRNLLIQCIQSVAGNTTGNITSTNKLLKQLRCSACVSGDGTQRLAHYFADGLEARLGGGRGVPEHINHAFKSPDAELWKAYKLYLTAFPFLETSYFFANETIMRLAEKAPSVHIIHFGIMHGLQWPPFIQKLSKRLGGPPKLRVTGIDLPRLGFRPDAMVERTKQRLASYCDQFNVPFEYNGYAKKWESVTVEDLKIMKDEVLVVNCLHHFMYLLDDTVADHSPRDDVLRLIKRINPDIFIHVVANGTYNSPFFVSRSREALFHFSTLFDMFDANLSRDNPMRMVFEKEIWGREITNIIACEGIERVERPETYKQWQLRTIRAGFQQLPLNEEIMKKIRDRVKSCFHKDFSVDVAGHWLLDGWKGRSLFGLSCWKPAN